MSIKRDQFRNKIHTALCLMGLIPYLLVGYTFNQLNFSLTQNISLLAAMILIFHFAGFHILRKFSDELLELIQSSTISGLRNHSKPLKIHKKDTNEIVQIKSNINILLEKVRYERGRFDDVTISLLGAARKTSAEYERRLKGISPYVNQKIMQQVIHNTNDERRELRSEKGRVAIMFVDICAFTRTSEHLEPEEVVIMLNDFFDVAVDIIYKHNGVVDKFIGDAIMVVFGINEPIYQVSTDAICTGLELQEVSKKLMVTWEKEGRTTFKIKIGINTGSVIIGDIGSRDRMDYTVIGDSVNVASRLTDYASADEVIVSHATYKNCKQYFNVMPKGSIQVKNRKKAIEVFSVDTKNETSFTYHNEFLTTGHNIRQQFETIPKIKLPHSKAPST